MSAEYKLSPAPGALRLEIKSDETSSYEDYIDIVNQAKTKLSGFEDTELQTFVNVRHEAELEFFLSNGFYVANTMLMMEKDLSETIDRIGSDINVQKRCLDILNNKEEMEKYLLANELGFDGVQDPEEQIVYQVSQPEGNIYVSEIKGEIASSVTVWQIDEKVFATENIFTIPKFREKHLASDLLTHVLNTLKEKGAKKARLSVYGDDYPALQMYLGLGFHIVDSNYELRY